MKLSDPLHDACVHSTVPTVIYSSLPYRRREAGFQAGVLPSWWGAISGTQFMHYIGRFAPFIFFLGLSFGRIIILEIYPLVHYTDLQHSRCNFSSHSLRSVNSQ